MREKESKAGEGENGETAPSKRSWKAHSPVYYHLGRTSILSKKNVSTTKRYRRQNEKGSSDSTRCSGTVNCEEPTKKHVSKPPETPCLGTHEKHIPIRPEGYIKLLLFIVGPKATLILTLEKSILCVAVSSKREHDENAQIFSNSRSPRTTIPNKAPSCFPACLPKNYRTRTKERTRNQPVMPELKRRPHLT